MSLRKTLKTTRTFEMRDTSCSTVSISFIANTQQWISEFLAIQEDAEKKEELQTLIEYITTFPDFEIDISFFEWCTAIHLFSAKQNEFVLSEKGLVFIELTKQSKLVIA